MIINTDITSRHLGQLHLNLFSMKNKLQSQRGGEGGVGDYNVIKKPVQNVSGYKQFPNGTAR